MKYLAFALLGAAVGLFIGIVQSEHDYRTQDPQEAAGSWAISIQLQPCDSPKNIKINMPERDGDVLTVYCQNMPVKVK